MSTSFVLLLLLGTAFAATHVNISIAQQPISKNNADVTYIDDKAPADLKAGQQDEKHQVEFVLANDNDKDQQSAKLQTARQPAKFYYLDAAVDESGHDGRMQNTRLESSEGRLARVQLAESQEQKQQDFNAGSSLGAHQAIGGHQHTQGVYSRGLSQRQRPSQLRLHQEQEKKNQEFERYIQKHHSGPTVETVFETSNPAPQRYQEPSSFSHSTASSSASSSSASSSPMMSDNARSGRIQKFERQVALPAAVTQVIPSVDAERQPHTIAIQQPKPITEPSQENVVVHTASVSRDSHNGGNTYPDQTNYGLSPGYDTSKTNLVQGSGYDTNNNAQGSGYDKTNTGHGSGYDNTNFGQGSGYDKNNHAQGSSYDKTNTGQSSSYDKTNIGQSFGQGSGYASYDKTNFDQANFNYNGAQHPSPQYPPMVNEHQGGYGGSNGYGGYYGSSDQSSFYGGQQSGARYYPDEPSYQHPVVTKTIQIAQPALKAKKFEIRHPAIQKEYYDIEERVVIKPAGTVVVELDHPVAKIPRGETILPLGHPHPAIANQYHDYNAQVGAQQHFSNAPGAYGNNERAASGAHYNNQYSSSAVHSPKPMRDSTTIASSITSTPSYDHNARGAIVEANLNGQFNEQTLFVPATEQSNKRVEDKPAQDSFYVATDSHGNQRQIPAKNLSPNMFSSEEQESHYPAHIEVKNRGASSEATTSFNTNSNNDGSRYVYLNEERHSKPSSSASLPSSAVQTDSNYNSGQFNYSPNNAQDQFQAEYFNSALNNNENGRENFKPARLRESPVLEETHRHAMKHEHKITLPPVQHTLYLTRSEQSPLVSMQQLKPQEQIQQSQKSARYEEETARVVEIKPYLQRHRDSVVVYSAPTSQPTARYSEERKSQRLTQSHDSDVQIDQHRGQLSNGNEGLSPVQYSAPYSQMRHHPEHSARLTYNKLYVIDNNRPSSFAYDRTGGGDKANLKVANDDKEVSQSEETKTINTSEENSGPITKTSGHHASAHIQIQLPHHPEEAGKPIIINSAIHPPKSHHSQEQMTKYRTTSSVTSSDAGGKNVQEVKEEDSAHFANLESAAQVKPDCEPATEHHSARYETLSSDQKPQQPNHHQYHSQQKFMRLVEAPEASGTSANSDSAAPVAVASIAAPINKPVNIDISSKSQAGHVATPGSRVIASTSAPTDSSSHSESFHKRRIVVNHPFQTVREVVEHEPITNYHQVQVKEPAPSAHYRTPYIQTHGALIYQSAAPVTHGNLQYAAPAGIPLHDFNDSYNQHN